MKKLPIGLQRLQEIIKDGYLYNFKENIDKLYKSPLQFKQTLDNVNLVWKFGKYFIGFENHIDNAL